MGVDTPKLNPDRKIVSEFTKLFQLIGDSTELLKRLEILINGRWKEYLVNNPNNIKYIITQMVELGILTPKFYWISIPNKFDVLITRVPVDGTQTLELKYRLYPKGIDVVSTGILKNFRDNELFQQIAAALDSEGTTLKFKNRDEQEL